LIVLTRWPRTTYPGIIQRLTNLRLLDYTITANVDPLPISQETQTWLPTVVPQPLSATSNIKSPISILLLTATIALADPPEAIRRITPIPGEPGWRVGYG
jgi:hypothetical protein